MIIKRFGGGKKPRLDENCTVFTNSVYFKLGYCSHWPATFNQAQVVQMLQ